MVSVGSGAPVNKPPTDEEVESCRVMRTDFYALAAHYGGLESLLDEIVS